MKVIGAILFLLAAGLSKAGQILPAHSHNDYEQKIPLQTAIKLGFRSVEADLFFTNNSLLVAHEPAHLDMTRTFEALYLQPLLHYSKTNENGRKLILLVDFKTEAEPAYLALKKVLEPFHSILTRYEVTTVTPGWSPLLFPATALIL